MREVEMNKPRFSRRGENLAVAAVLAIVLLTGCAATPTVTPAARTELAPTGKLRVGLLVTNRAYVIKDGPAAEMQGVGVDLGRELARQLNTAFEPVRYRNVAALLDGARKGEWDVAPIGYSAERTGEMDFTGLYTVGRNRYLVPADSAIQTVADVDDSKHRITVIARSVQATHLETHLKRAAVIRTKTFSEALEHLASGKAHAYFASEATLSNWVATRPAFRIAEGSVIAGGNALAIAKGRPAGRAYANEFIEYVKASGWLQQAIERNGQDGVIVAPPGAMK